MSRAKRYVLKKMDNPVVATATNAIIFSQNISKFNQFSVTVKSSATALVSITIQTAPQDTAELFSNITATSVAAASGTDGVVTNTFDGNQLGFLRVIASSTATIAAGALTTYFTAITD